MKRVLLIPLMFVPLLAGAAATPAPSSSIPTNAYVANPHVTISSSLPADLITAGGTVNILASVAGDILAAAGTLSVAQGAGGDVRVVGAKVLVNGPVGGDIAAAGGTVRIVGSARSIYAAGASVDVEGSSAGDVTIYGANVFLSGEYQGNVSVIASNRLRIGEGTHIHGQLKYSAPEELSLPANAVIDGGARYTGAYAYVPTSKQAHQYALVGTILFFAVRVLAGVIVAGLVAGLFPGVAERISTLLLVRDARKVGKLFIIGLLITIGTPLLCLLLLVSFVGAELALLLMVSYIFLALIAYAFTGIFAGALLRKTLFKTWKGEREINWQDAVIGTILIHLLGLLPLIGTPVVFLLTLCSVGALCVFIYRAAFLSNH